MKNNNLRAIEALLRNSHELAISAREEAAEGCDAVLQHRMAALAKLIAAELSAVRANIKGKAGRPSVASAKDGRAG